MNESGRNTLRMAELRDVLHRRGLSPVSTVAQSGNVLLPVVREEMMEAELENLIQVHCGYDIRAILRTKEDLLGIIERASWNPESTVNTLADLASRIFSSKQANAPFERLLSLSRS